VPLASPPSFPVPFESDGGSWWFDEALTFEGRPGAAPRLEGEDRADVVVIGGGFSGLWAAIALKERDPALDVVLLESSIIGRSPSGMNGGFMSGYRIYETAFAKSVGPKAAREVVDAGEEAQTAITAFLGDDADRVWLSEEPTYLIATSAHQLAQLEARVAQAEKGGALEVPRLLRGKELHERLAFSTFKGALVTSKSATVHPARLVRLLRQRAIDQGVRVHEHSRVDDVSRAAPHVVTTEAGRVVTPRVVLATNYRGTRTREGRLRLTTLSSYGLVTAPMPELLDRTGWGLGRGGRDARIFLNWFRSTPDGRMIHGSAVGPIARGDRAAPAVGHAPTVRRLVHDYRAIFPELAEVPIERAWAGPIDMSSDQFPFIGSRPGGSIAYGYGLSGHGVNAAWIVGQCLASVVLGLDDRWARSPFVRRRPVRLPPEPLRYIAGNFIKKAVVRVEDALDADRRPSAFDTAISDIPRLLRMRVGIRD
jgi:glycine/D-amino acid oxidase-like deaminating enzyme